MATHDLQWTGSWCKPTDLVPDDIHIEHKTQKPQVHHQAILPLGSTASMDEHRLAVLGDFIKCWQAYVEFAKMTMENGRCSLLGASLLALKPTIFLLVHSKSHQNEG